MQGLRLDSTIQIQVELSRLCLICFHKAKAVQLSIHCRSIPPTVITRFITSPSLVCDIMRQRLMLKMFVCFFGSSPLCQPRRLMIKTQLTGNVPMGSSLEIKFHFGAQTPPAPVRCAQFPVSLIPVLTLLFLASSRNLIITQMFRQSRRQEAKFPLILDAGSTSISPILQHIQGIRERTWMGRLLIQAN